MALLVYSSSMLSGVEYDTGDSFMNYGIGVGAPDVAADRPDTICFGFAGNIKSDHFLRNFNYNDNQFNWFNYTQSTTSSNLVVPINEFTQTTTYDFAFAADDQLQFICQQGDGLFIASAYNVSSVIMAEIVGDNNSYITANASCQETANVGDNPYSYGGAASSPDPATSTAGITLPVACELTYVGATISFGGAVDPISADYTVRLMLNGALQDSLTITAGNTVGAFTGAAIPYARGDVFSLESGTNNADLATAQILLAFRVT